MTTWRIERLVDAFADAGLALDAEDLLDGVWLAGRGIGAGAAPPRAFPEAPDTTANDGTTTSGKTGDDGAEPADRTGQDSPDSGPGRDARQELYLPTDDGGVGGRRVRLSGAPAIARRLEIDRAFKPLRARRASLHKSELDEEGTVEAMADSDGFTGNLKYRASRERWLDVMVVIESSPTMRLWQDTAREFREALQRGAAPMRLRSFELAWSIGASRDKRLQLRNARGQPAASLALGASGTTRAIFHVTDAVGPGWLSADIPEQLLEWSQRAAVVVVQVLPQELWDQSSFNGINPTPPAGAEPVRRWRRGASGLPGVYVCRIDPSHLAHLAAHWAGRAGAQVAQILGQGSSAAALFCDRAFDPTVEPPPTRPDGLTASEVDQRYADFINLASHGARRLGVRLASIPAGIPLGLSLIRLVQRVLVPDAVPSQLAELFLAGLLQRERAGQQIGEPAYQFVGDIRARLEHDAGPEIRIATRAMISDYLERRQGKGAAFDAAVPVPSGIESNTTVTREAEGFASVSTALVGASPANVGNLDTSVGVNDASPRKADIPSISSVAPTPKTSGVVRKRDDDPVWEREIGKRVAANDREGALILSYLGGLRQPDGRFAEAILYKCSHFGRLKRDYDRVFEDAVQSLLTKWTENNFKPLFTLRDPANLDAVMRTCVQRECMNLLKRKGARSAEPVAMELLAIPNDPDERFEFDETFAIIESYKKELSLEDLEILGLMVDGFPPGELADSARDDFNLAASKLLAERFPDRPTSPMAVGQSVSRIRKELAALLELQLKRRKRGGNA